MPLSTAPHDSLFRALVSNPRRAAALLREHLPDDMAALIDFGHPPEPQEGSFVDGTGAKAQCDALFRVRLKGGQDALERVGFDRIDVFTRHALMALISAVLVVASLPLCLHGAISRLILIAHHEGA